MAKVMNSVAAMEQSLRKLATSLPKVETGKSCTKTAFKVGGKSFLFVGCDERACSVMLKLRESLPEAAEMAKKQPACFKAGSGGWVTMTFAQGDRPPKGLLDRWVEESYRLFAPSRERR